MARFVLKENISDRMLGIGLLVLASLKSMVRKSTLSKDPADVTAAEDAIAAVEDHIKSEFFDISQAQGPSGREARVRVKYHYDGISEEGYVLHIVVPDIGDKEVELTSAIERGGLPKLNLPIQTELPGTKAKYDFTDFAAESLGHIVLFGCGR